MNQVNAFFLSIHNGHMSGLIPVNMLISISNFITAPFQPSKFIHVHLIMANNGSLIASYPLHTNKLQWAQRNENCVSKEVMYCKVKNAAVY